MDNESIPTIRPIQIEDNPTPLIVILWVNIHTERHCHHLPFGLTSLLRYTAIGAQIMKASNVIPQVIQMGDMIQYQAIGVKSDATKSIRINAATTIE